jgi:hypothetical protein
MNTDYFAALIAPKSNEGGNSALQPPLAPLLSAADRMAKEDTQKAKGDIRWQSARTFGQESMP